MSATQLSGNQITEFRTLFELCRLAEHEPENPVSIPLLVSACNLARDDFNQVLGTLKKRRLIAFDTLLDYLRITHFGVSEIVTAKAQPGARTHYFPSLKTMGIRLRQGHHLFDSVEPVWPEKSASTGLTTDERADTRSDDLLQNSLDGFDVDLQPLISELQELQLTLGTHGDAGDFPIQLAELEALIEYLSNTLTRQRQADAIPHVISELVELKLLL